MTTATINQSDKSASYKWLDQLSLMNRQIFMVSNKDLNVEFISQYTLDFLEIEFDLAQLPSPLPYKHVLAHLSHNGYFGQQKAEGIIKRLISQNKAQLNASPLTSEEIDIITPSGRRIHVKQMVTTDGHLLLVGDDVTQDNLEKHALKLALDSSQSGYGVYDRITGNFTIHGDLFRNHFTPDTFNELDIKSTSKLIHPDDYEKCRIAWENGIRTQQPWEITYRVTGSNGRSIWLKTHYTPQPSKDGNLTKIIYFSTDVTSTIRIQNELQQVSNRTQNTLKAKNEFIGRLSHEMRTPMNAVIGIADALIHHNHDPSIKPKLELIQTSADKIIRILDETLQHAKLEEHKVELNPRFASPANCVETLCQLWEEKAANSDITLSYQIDSNIPEQINFDDFRFEQCLNNLLSNAIKFTTGGEIKVIQTLVEKAGQTYLITAVKDNGIGMSESQQANIFEAFTQADNSISGRFGGTGLGMSITKNIIELMGGRITLNSTQGKGSVFVLSLPIVTPVKTQLPQTPKDVNRLLVDTILEENTLEPTGYEDLRILVVDDNPTNHLVVKSLLETLVKEIVTADNGVQAIQALEAQEFDLVLMDIHMPVMDGIEATLAIRGCDEAFTNIPIIALTADPQYQQKRLCKNIGMNGALGKPIKLNDLLAEVEQVLEQKPASSTLIDAA